MSAVEMLKSYRRNADEMLFKEPTLYAKKQMPKTTCQKSNERNVNMICQVYDQNTEKVMKYIKKTKEKSEYVRCPSSLKQMNFKTKCFSSLIVTMNTEVIIFNIRLSITTKLNHEIQEQWHLAPMLVYDSIHP